MSFQDKDFWIAKDIEHLNDGDAAFNNPSTIDSKRPNQWIVDSTESELFSNKKQAVRSLDSNLTPSGVPNLSIPLWDNTSTFHQVPNQFIDRLFGTGTARSVNFSENSISPVGDDSMNLRIKHIDEQFGNDPSAGLSISHASEDPEIFLSYGGIRKVKVNQVKGPSSNKYVHSPKQHSCNKEAGSLISRGPASLSLLGHTYNSSGDSYVKSVGPAFNKRDDDTLPMDHSYAGDNSTISFSCFHDDPSIPLSGLSGSYDFLTNQSSVQMSEMSSEKELHSPEANAVARPARNAKSGPDSKKKPEPKVSKKEAPNSFPSNVKSLLSTGMLDGVPVKYVSLQRQELRGIIKGSGYLCGCKSCNFSKALNAYEFERHANCKSKHPNNHIYFENGKTIYQIVQELKGTPESKLFDTIQTVFGAPINQKAFRIWKESFQAATRELQRIYGKDELNL